MGSSEDNEAVVRACFQAGTDGNLGALDAIISPTSSCTIPVAPRRFAASRASRRWSKATETLFPICE